MRLALALTASVLAVGVGVAASQHTNGPRHASPQDAFAAYAKAHHGRVIVLDKTATRVPGY